LGGIFWRGRRRNHERVKEKPGEEEANKTLERREDAKYLCGFLLVDWCCWDFRHWGEEI
jgi:hypothetical protein